MEIGYKYYWVEWDGENKAGYVQYSHLLCVSVDCTKKPAEREYVMQDPSDLEVTETVEDIFQTQREAELFIELEYAKREIRELNGEEPNELF